MLSEPEASKRCPSTAIDAKFSLPFTVSVALLDGEVTLDSFSPAALTRADIAQMAQRVHVTIDEAAPAHAIVAGVTTVTLAGGQTFTRAMPQALGHPLMPMSDADLAAKFRMCAERAARPLDEASADRVIAVIADLENHTDAARAITGAMEPLA